MSQRNLLAALAVAVTVGLVVGVDRAVGAAGYPASYWMARPMSVPVPMCVNAAGKALAASGISSITKDAMSTGGYTPTTRGYIVCVRLPRAGSCNGDGATAVLVTAGSDAKALIDTINTNLKSPVLIDCGTDH